VQTSAAELSVFTGGETGPAAPVQPAAPHASAHATRASERTNVR